jgi:tRNA 2-thiouridine synthesizing protein E
MSELIITIEGKDYDIDEDGFIQDPAVWNEIVAKGLAATEGVDDLTEDHWKVVNYLRDYYLEYNIAPMIRKLCKETGFKLKEIYDLFPSGPAKGACKVAGLPKPTGCV